MSFVVIVVFLVIAGLFLAMYASPAVKEKLATAWAALVALLLAIGAWLASWWADVPVDVPPM